MTNEVATEFKSLKDIVSDKIKNEFVNLIPAEQWEKMIENEVNNFMNDTPKDRYGNGGKDSEITTLIKSALREKANETIKEVLNTEIFDGKTHANGKPMIKAQFQKFILDNASLMFSTILTDAISSNLNNFRMQLEQKMRGY